LRGHFLDIIISIEEKISLFLEKTLIPKNLETKRVFTEKILHSKDLTLLKKIKLLKEIIEVKKYLNQNDLDKLYSSLEYVVSERNKWAHGSLIFEQKKKNKKLKFQAYMTYLNNEGKFSEDQLNDTYFNLLNKKLLLINNNLVKVLVKMKLLPKDYLKKPNVHKK